MNDLVVLSSSEVTRQECEKFLAVSNRLLTAEQTSALDPDHFNALLNYARLQITRVTQWSDGPADLLAGTTRNLLEWSLWCQFIVEDPKNLDVLTKDARADLVDLISINPALDEVLYRESFSSQELSAERTEALMKTRASIDTVLKAFENDVGRLPKRLRLDGLRNRLDDYVFKACSKEIHPTATSLLMTPRMTNAETEARLTNFRTLALHYANLGLNALMRLITGS